MSKITLTWVHLSDTQFAASRTYATDELLQNLLLDVNSLNASVGLCPDLIAVASKVSEPANKRTHRRPEYTGVVESRFDAAGFLIFARFNHLFKECFVNVLSVPGRFSVSCND